MGFFKSKDNFAKLLLMVSIFIIEWPVLRQVYVFADEGRFENFASTNLLPVFWKTWVDGFYYDGRPFSLVIVRIFEIILSIHPESMILLRGCIVSASMILATATYQVLRSCRISIFPSFILVLIMWFQPSFFLYPAFLHLGPYLLGMFASLNVTHRLIRSTDEKRDLKPIELALVAALYLLGLLIFQGSPFFGLPFMAIYVVRNWATNEKVLRNSVKVLGVFIFVVTIYSLTFRFLFLNHDSYYRAGRLFFSLEKSPTSFLLAMLDPSKYWRVFEFWNYPLRSSLNEEQAKSLALICMFLWAFYGVATFLQKLRAVRLKKHFLFAWSLAFFLGLLTFLPMASDQFTGRQHLMTNATVSFILSTFALFCFCKPLLKIQRLLKPLAFCCVIWLAVGAQRALQKSVVDPSLRLSRYLISKAEASPNRKIDSILVSTWPESVDYTGCRSQPCGGFFSRQLPPRVQILGHSVYSIPLRIDGFTGEMKVLEMPARGRTLDTTLVIDWNPFAQNQFRDKWGAHGF